MERPVNHEHCPLTVLYDVLAYITKNRDIMPIEFKELFPEVEINILRYLFFSINESYYRFFRDHKELCDKNSSII